MTLKKPEKLYQNSETTFYQGSSPNFAAMIEPG